MIIPDSITTIGYYAFSSCDKLTSVNISDSITTLEAGVFSSCLKLENISFGNGVTTIGNGAFSGCTSLKELIIPDQVTTIHNSAFSSCHNLTHLSIGKGVTTVEKGVFSNCYMLSEIYFNAESMNDLSNSDQIFSSAGTKGDGIRFIIGKDAKRIPYNLFSISNKDDVQANVVTVEFEEGSTCSIFGDFSFNIADTLTNVYIYDVAVWCNTRYGHYQLMSWIDNLYLNGELVDELVIPEGVTEIPSYAFYGSSISSVSIPDSVTEIGYYAFANCKKLSSISLPDNHTYIGEFAFANCINLMTVTIPKNLAYLEPTVFDGCVKLVEICNLSNIDLSEYGDITKYALNIYSDTEGEKRTSVTDDGFVSYSDRHVCYLIGYIGDETHISVPYYRYIIEIYPYAFYGNSTLESVELPSSVAKIGEHAFYGCDSLTSIEFWADPTRFTYIDSDIIESDRASAVDIYYFGTYEDLEKVTNGTDYLSHNSVKMYFYTEREPVDLPKDENYGYWYRDWEGNIIVW